MLKRVIIALTLVAVGAGTAAIVFAAIVLPSHQAVGEVNTAVSVGEGLFICQPSGTIVSPICPIDTIGADETIFAASEDLLPGQVAWQIIRVTNVGSDPWDIFSFSRIWTEIADPGSDCFLLPEAVVYVSSSTTGNIGVRGGSGPGVTILGKIPSSFDNPVDGTLYDGGINDNHEIVESSVRFEERRTVSGSRTVHVEPGDYEDLLLGIRLSPTAPNECLDNVWQLETTWTVQLHSAP